jgi:hypothetical protein
LSLLEPVRLTVPPEAVTITLPLALPGGTTAVIRLGDITLTVAAVMPPNCTLLTLIKFVPIIVTVCPGIAVVGIKLVIVGGGMCVNPGCVTVPPGVVTDTTPSAPVPTTASMRVEETTV